MLGGSSQRGVRAGAVGCLVIGMVALGGESASAQRLWSIGDVGSGVAASAVTVDGLNPPSVEVAEITVEFDYLRVGMGYLELPLADGSMVEAENAVFEDRGGGNLMWSGEVPGAGYESVLFTVQDGHLVGWFGEPGGPKYVVHAGADGRGTLAVEAGPTGDWCGVTGGPADPLGRTVATTAADRPTAVPSQSSDDRLDILVLYASGTERYWRAIGGPAVGVQQLADYLNMVFRNGAISATADLTPVRWDPELFNRPSTQGWHFADRSSFTALWHSEFHSSPEVMRLRRRYMPDLVHFVPAVASARAGGQAGSRNDLEPRVFSGWSTPHGFVFAHEIGHNLGGHHEPVTFGNEFTKFQSEAFRPYAFGHTDMTSCAKREGYGDLLVCPRTAMSYGWDAFRDDNPETWSVVEPFYSSVRYKPNGWTIGVPGTSEVERVLHETLPVAVRSGEAPYAAEQFPRTINAHWTGHDTVRVTWPEPHRDRWHWKRWFFQLAPTDGAEGDWYQLIEGDPPPDVRTSRNVKPVLQGDDLVGVEIGGLQPAAKYRVSVIGPGSALRSDVFELTPPRHSGAPAAPGNVGAEVAGPNSVSLRWRDNSSVETGYEVWWRRWSGDRPDKTWRRQGRSLPAGASSSEIRGLMADEEIRVTDTYRRWDPETEDYVSVEAETTHVGRYSFVVVAYNRHGFSASETLNYEFAPGPYPPPTRSGRTSACRRRASGLVLDGYWVEMCVETPDGERFRVWDYELDADRSGLLYFFDRDNVEVLVKVLDGCAINGHRWVFVAPVTNLAFRLAVRELASPHANRRQVWHYDSERRPQEDLYGSGTPRSWRYGESQEYVGNAQGRTARTVSDTTAFPCTAGEIAAAKASSAAPALSAPSSPERLIAGAATDCEPGEPTLTLRGGYTVSMCYETYDGRVGDARDWGLDSTQSGLMYFFERDNAEVLIKVLDACGVNGYRWVFVAPVTDLAFNLRVESPDGQRWTHTNRLGQTADAKSDVSAFPCSSTA